MPVVDGVLVDVIGRFLLALAREGGAPSQSAQQKENLNHRRGIITIQGYGAVANAGAIKGIIRAMSQNAARVVFPGFKFGIDDPALAETLVDLGGGVLPLRGFDPRGRGNDRPPAGPRPAALLFSADYEDGVASQTPGETPFPSNMGLGAAGDPALARKRGAHRRRIRRPRGSLGLRAGGGFGHRAGQPHRQRPGFRR